jgi:Spy/CpxP family protein refolding chaperone
MKASIKLLVSLLALGFAGASFAQAADEAPASEKPAKGQRPDRTEMRGNPQGRLKEISEQLALTDEQKTKVADIFKANAADLKEARGDRAKMAELMKAQREQIHALLTPEQQAKFETMKREGRPGGKPQGKRGDKPGKEGKAE